MKVVYKMRMLKIRSKTEMTVIVMVFITIVLILAFILATSDILIDSSMAKDKNTIPLLLKNTASSKLTSSSTSMPNGLMSRNQAEERMIDKLRQDQHQDIVGKILASQHQDNNLHSESDYMPFLRKKQKKYKDSHDDLDSGLVDERRNNFSFNGHRIVHLDLKGAPPQVLYYEDLFPLLRTLGATGILIEYEDMFPYYGILSDISAHNAYKTSDIKHILKIASNNKLEVIPLIQTFGHLEFILKLENFSYLREVPKYPQVVCPTHNDTFPVLTTMIDQVMELHPNIKYLHIGCDEVYYLGNCERCGLTMFNNKWTKSQLFLNHVIRIAKYIKKTYPHVKPLTWDDEFRNLPESELQESRVSRWLEPVVWKYTPDVLSSITTDIWEKYISIFPHIWIASAFKGATGPDKYVTDISFHLSNHQAWMDVVDLYKYRVKFQGIMLTGWQRYDHFAVLCELLPVGLPSLAFNLEFIQGKMKGMRQIRGRTAEILKCDPPIPLRPTMKLSQCGFPGASVLAAAVRLNTLQYNLDQYLSLSSSKGWFTSYNRQYGFSSPSLVEQATAELDHCKMELMYIKKDMIAAMSDIFDRFTTQEWIDTYIQPLDEKLQNLWEAKEKLLAKRHWPRRPLESSQTHEKSSLIPPFVT